LPTVAAVYTALTLVEPIKELFRELLPDCRLINIVDDSLIQDVIRDGRPSPSVIRRLLVYYQAGFDAGADVILNTCSSVGEVVDLARPIFERPIFKIDQPMAAKAVRTAHSIGVLATLPTTLVPTIRLVQSEAEKIGKKIEIVEGLAEGAFTALMSGDAQGHDALIRETALKIAEKVEIIVLAQGSMARMEEPLMKHTGKIVLSSPRLGVLGVKEFLTARDNENR